MKKLSLILTLVLMLAVNVTVLAQDDEEEERDFLEVGLFGGMVIPSEGVADFVSRGDDYNVAMGAKTGLGLGAEIGAFLNANLVLGVNFTYSTHSVDATDGEIGDLKHRFYNPSVYLKYYLFGESNFAPYAKIHVGVDNPRFVTQVVDFESGGLKMRELSYDPVFSFGAGGGLFYYTSDYSGLFLEVNGHYGNSKNTQGSFQDATYDFNESSILVDVHLGVKVFFSTGE
ncbi:MAG: hypothetical protein JSU65_09025 [Candidatus Zixiibacteriota bacterium]|nr:MAG: hypothetical protein JSU65_09025 [candidate division Zixibacteria bacterium]